MRVRYRYCTLWCALSNRRGSICQDTLRRKTPFAGTRHLIPQLLQSTERFFLCLKRYQSAELSCEPLTFPSLGGRATKLTSSFAAVKITLVGLSNTVRGPAPSRRGHLLPVLFFRNQGFTLWFRSLPCERLARQLSPSDIRFEY